MAWQQLSGIGSGSNGGGNGGVESSQQSNQQQGTEYTLQGAWKLALGDLKQRHNVLWMRA